MELSQEQKLYTEVVQKAWEDADFKKELTTNPVKAIENLTGKKMTLPAGKTLVVRDQTDDSTVYINIPAKPEIDAELNEEQLEMAAGGCWDDGSGIPKHWEPTPTFPKVPWNNIILTTK
jgi:hypothetical protein